jgi:hypothetical protein
MAKKKGKKKWMQEAFSKNQGAFTAKAKKAGMTPTEYANRVTGKGGKATAKTKRQANLVKTAGKIAKRRKK